MTGHAVTVAGIEIPSDAPIFLTIVGLHVFMPVEKSRQSSMRR
jgi:hypothetical protein